MKYGGMVILLILISEIFMKPLFLLTRILLNHFHFFNNIYRSPGGYDFAHFFSNIL